MSHSPATPLSSQQPYGWYSTEPNQVKIEAMVVNQTAPESMSSGDGDQLIEQQEEQPLDGMEQLQDSSSSPSQPPNHWSEASGRHQLVDDQFSANLPNHVETNVYKRALSDESETENEQEGNDAVDEVEEEVVEGEDEDEEEEEEEGEEYHPGSPSGQEMHHYQTAPRFNNGPPPFNRGHGGPSHFHRPDPPAFRRWFQPCAYTEFGYADKNENDPYMPTAPTLDPYMAPGVFQNVNDKLYAFDESVNDAIKQKLSVLNPTNSELAELSTMVNNVTQVLNKITSPGAIDAARIDSVHQVGSFKMGTMLKDHRTADLVIVLKTLPVRAAIQAMGNKIMDEMLLLDDSNNGFHVLFRDDHLEVFTTYDNTYKVFLHFTTYQKNIIMLEKGLHVKKRYAIRNLLAIDHVKWFEEVVKPQLQVTNLIRVFKAMTYRYIDFREINPWMTINLANYCMTYTGNGQHLPLPVAFKRIFQLMSAGIFLPYSAGIIDPVNPVMPIHGRLSFYALEAITVCAQVLFRLIFHEGGIEYVLFLKGHPKSKVNPPEGATKWGEVTVSPSVSVYEGTGYKAKKGKKSPVKKALKEVCTEEKKTEDEANTETMNTTE